MDVIALALFFQVGDELIVGVVVAFAAEIAMHLIHGLDGWNCAQRGQRFPRAAFVRAVIHDGNGWGETANEQGIVADV